MAYGSQLSEALDPSPQRKSRGAFFTPPELADFIAGYAIVDCDDRVLEPACGEAEFMRAATDRLMRLGATSQQVEHGLVGCEIHEESAVAARCRLGALGISPHIEVVDFFDKEPFPDQAYEAVIGNPPYIRYQEFTGEQRRKARESAFSMGVRLDALASSWAPFVVHSARFLAEGGRLGFVLPAELLTTNYAAPVRRFLIESFSEVKVVLFERPVFPEVQEEVVLLCAGGFRQGSSRCIALYQVDSVAELERAGFLSVEVSGDGRWPVGRAAYDAQTLLSSLGDVSIVALSTYGDIRLGAVSGANDFFALTESRVRELELAEDDVIPLCPPGSKSLRTLTFGTEDLRCLRDAGKQTFLFSPPDQPSEAAQRYIRQGEIEGIAQRYKCRSRSPWWRVPGLRVCDLFLTYMNGAGPNLCENEAGVVFLNSVHGLTLRDGLDVKFRKLLPMASLSSVTLLSAELVGRSYGGGVLKIEPREAARLLVLSPSKLLECSDALMRVRPEVERLLAAGKRDAATLKIDDTVFPLLGIGERDARSLHGLLLELRSRRERRGKGKAGTEGGGA